MTKQDAPVYIIGVPLDLGAGRRGVDMGPSALRIAGMDDRIATLGRKVIDRGDIVTPTRETCDEGDPGKKYIREITTICQMLFDCSLDAQRAGGVPVVLGGDHSLAAGSVGATAANARGRELPVGLLWVDAHGDMNTPDSSGSGNVHGMPLAALLGKEPRELAELGGFAPKVLPHHTVLMGVRNLDAREKEIVRASGVHVFTMKDIDRLGVAAVTEQAIAIALNGTAGIHVSFDLDVCDPAIAPGVGTPVKGGLDYREAHVIMEMLSDSGRVLAIDVVEVNPVLDTQNATAILGTELVLSALGLRIL